MKRFGDELEQNKKYGQQSLPGYGSSKTHRRKRRRLRKKLDEKWIKAEPFRRSYPYFEVLEGSHPYKPLDNYMLSANPDSFVQQFSSIVKPPIGLFDPTSYSFVRQNSIMDMNYMKLFNRPPRDIKESIDDELVLAAEHVLSLMKLDNQLSFPGKGSPSQIRCTGFIGIDYVFSDFKGSALNFQINFDANYYYDQLMSGEHVEPHDVIIEGRGKLITNKELNDTCEDKITEQIKFMMSHRDMMIAGVTENTLSLEYSADKFPVALGTSWWQGGTDKFLGRWIGFDHYYHLKAEKFDVSVQPWMVKLALNLLRFQYVDGSNEEYDAYWDFIYEGLVETSIYINDGFRFKKFVGTAPGHPFNILVQSIISLIIGYTSALILFKDLEPAFVFEHIWIEALGDDTLIGIKGLDHKPKVEDFAKVVDASFGIDWSGDKNFSTPKLLDFIEGEFQGIQFLGKHFRLSREEEMLNGEKYAIPYRPAEETYMKLYYPDRCLGTTYLDDSHITVLANLYDASGNTEMQLWMIQYVKWLRDKPISKYIGWGSYLTKWLERAYSQVARAEVPKVELITKDKWLKLVFG